MNPVPFGRLSLNVTEFLDLDYEIIGDISCLCKVIDVAVSNKWNKPMVPGFLIANGLLS